MRGAVAAGHPLTAMTGARILEEGGNAVDACIAAGFTSWVTESPLTGPGAGGFMLVHRARDGSDRLFDFFVSLPGREEPDLGLLGDVERLLRRARPDADVPVRLDAEALVDDGRAASSKDHRRRRVG